jgi:hypothetical protein
MVKPRLTRTLTAGLVAGAALIAMAGSAVALPPPGDPPPPAGDPVYAISGRVTVKNCPGITPDRVTVTAMPTNISSDGGGVTRPSSTGTYTIGGLYREKHTVSVRLDPGLVCPYARWSATSLSVLAPSTTTNFTYSGPALIKKVNGNILAATLQSKLSGVGLHLDDFGPQVGQSHQQDLASSLTWGGVSYPFTIPEIQYNLEKCLIVCVDIGQARFYVNDMDLMSANFSWFGPNFLGKLAFESGGREVQGWYTDATTGIVSDGLMPDVNIDNAQLTASFLPTAINGQLSYNVGSVTLAASIQATGGCDILGIDPCNFFTNYKARVATEIQNAVKAKLSDASVKKFAADALDVELTNQGMPVVDRVVVEGDLLVLLKY